ncbi:UNKNOWN [Stylonychia lemnae]|uniref:Uncharacterized protein n=1 Tax=Stylonychia lemnae TaxID=5949 RepID=A0A078AM31_STYLE|nr:UNKNOWN [Stylonychia lemnae]|eukprot:CDW83284.1 UNKNOWN [Stylonychia lemnae]
MFTTKVKTKALSKLFSPSEVTDRQTHQSFDNTHRRQLHNYNQNANNIHIDFKQRHQDNSISDIQDIKGKYNKGVFKNRYYNNSFADTNQQSIIAEKDEQGPENNTYHRFIVKNHKHTEREPQNKKQIQNLIMSRRLQIQSPETQRNKNNLFNKELYRNTVDVTNQKDSIHISQINIDHQNVSQDSLDNQLHSGMNAISLNKIRPQTSKNSSKFNHKNQSKLIEFIYDKKKEKPSRFYYLYNSNGSNKWNESNCSDENQTQPQLKQEIRSLLDKLIIEQDSDIKAQNQLLKDIIAKQSQYILFLENTCSMKIDHISETVIEDQLHILGFNVRKQIDKIDRLQNNVLKQNEEIRRYIQSTKNMKKKLQFDTFDLTDRKHKPDEEIVEFAGETQKMRFSLISESINNTMDFQEGISAREPYDETICIESPHITLNPIGDRMVKQQANKKFMKFNENKGIVNVTNNNLSQINNSPIKGNPSYRYANTGGGFHTNMKSSMKGSVQPNKHQFNRIESLL